MQAQYLVTENFQSSAENISYKRHFDSSAYSKINENNGKTTYIRALNSTQRLNDVYTLTLDLDFDLSVAVPQTFMVYNEEGLSAYVIWDGSSTEIEIPVYGGTYDIFTVFTGVNGRDYIVIKELITVNGNTAIEVGHTEAENFIVATLYDENWEIVEPGILDISTGTVNGGTGEVVFDRIIFSNVLKFPISASHFVWGMKLTQDDQPQWPFYINTLSDRYAIIQDAMGLGYNKNQYFTRFNTLIGNDESVNLANSTYIVHHARIKPSKYGEDIANSYFGFSTSTVVDGLFLNGWTVYREFFGYDFEEGFNCFLDNSEAEDIANLLVYPSIVEDVDFANYNSINGNAIMAGENGEIIYGSGNTALIPSPLIHQEFYNESNGKIYPFHPRFSFNSIENPDIIQGNNTPIFVNTIFSMPDIFTYFNVQYRGRFGELRESDFITTQLEINHENSEIYTGDLSSLMGFMLPTQGLLEFYLTNTNILIDNFESENTAKFTFNAGDDDSFPTLQFLQFRNSQGQVTDRFSSSDEGSLRLAAGIFDYEPMMGVFEFQPGVDVEVFYSLHDENNWVELDLTKFPEYELPGFGEYFEASLETITNPQTITWYDLKIICKSTQGNTQEQIVSHAFRIGDIMGVEEISNQGDIVVYPNPFSNQLNILLPENLNGNFTFKVYETTGKLIHSENRTKGLTNSFTWNSSKLPKGIYIISIENRSKTITKKVIKF